MNKLLISLFISAASIVAFAGQKSGIIMTVDGNDIPTEEFEYLFTKNLQQQEGSQSIDDYIELFKIYRMKVAEAKQEGKDTTQAFKDEMAQYRRDLVAPYIVDSAFIYSLIEIAVERDKREVEVNHIMMIKNSDDAQNARSLMLLDSLRKEIYNGASFNELAASYSQDKSATKNAGYLGYIQAGKYPYDFESAAFETPEGEISEIVETPAGYHIVKPGASRQSKGKVEVAHIMKLAPKDNQEIIDRKKIEIDSIYALVLKNPENFAQLAMDNSDDKMTSRKGGVVPVFGVGEMLKEFETKAFALNDNEISEPFLSPVAWHIMKKMGSKPAGNREEIKESVMKKISNAQDPRNSLIRQHNIDMLSAKFGSSHSPEELVELEEVWQFQNNPDYRNLVNEYTDGSMLYEISLEKVWNKAAEDNEGLQKYYKDHLADYTWTQPYAKGILVQAKNDSISTLIKNGTKDLKGDEALQYIKSNFPGMALAEKIVMPEGRNEMVDHLMFGGKDAKPKAKGFTSYFILEGRVISQPEEMNDVKGAVIADYQESLEKQWVESLKKNHKVVVNKKELEKVRKRFEAKKE